MARGWTLVVLAFALVDDGVDLGHEHERQCNEHAQAQHERDEQVVHGELVLQRTIEWYHNDGEHDEVHVWPALCTGSR